MLKQQPRSLQCRNQSCYYGSWVEVGWAIWFIKCVFPHETCYAFDISTFFDKYEKYFILVMIMFGFRDSYFICVDGSKVNVQRGTSAVIRLLLLNGETAQSGVQGNPSHHCGPPVSGGLEYSELNIASHETAFPLVFAPYLSHPGIPGVTLCFCTGSYAAAAAASGRRFLFFYF